MRMSGQRRNAAGGSSTSAANVIETGRSSEERIPDASIKELLEQVALEAAARDADE